VRRAVEELKVAADFNQVRSILTAAFETNDFDAFELQVKSLHGDRSQHVDATHTLHWSKLPHMIAISSQPSWNLALDLVTTSNRRRGSLVVFRAYSQRDLHLDVNLLTSEFPVALADALDRALAAPQVVIAAAQGDRRYLAANL
jgi:hypothetical protein